MTVAIPTLTAGRVENLYDLMDRPRFHRLGAQHLAHKPIIDVKPGRNER